jgi:hypothetical protein
MTYVAKADWNQSFTTTWRTACPAQNRQRMPKQNPGILHATLTLRFYAAAETQGRTFFCPQEKDKVPENNS